MKNIKAKISTLISGKKSSMNIDDLISYPKESMGFHLGCFLFNNSCEQDPVAGREDIFRLLLTREVSNKEEIAMHFYLFGNGCNSLQTLFVMATGVAIFPNCIPYFYGKYKDGKNALRFYDLDYFRMLHLPLKRVKDTFLIR